MTAHKIAKSSSSKITVFRPDLLIAFTKSSSKTTEKKCLNFPDASASTAPMPALTLEDSGSKHASVKMKNTCEIDRWTTLGLWASRHERYNFTALMVTESKTEFLEEYACPMTMDNAFLANLPKSWPDANWSLPLSLSASARGSRPPSRTDDINEAISSLRLEVLSIRIFPTPIEDTSIETPRAQTWLLNGGALSRFSKTPSQRLQHEAGATINWHLFIAVRKSHKAVEVTGPWYQEFWCGNGPQTVSNTKECVHRSYTSKGQCLVWKATDLFSPGTATKICENCNESGCTAHCRYAPDKS